MGEKYFVVLRREDEPDFQVMDEKTLRKFLNNPDNRVEDLHFIDKVSDRMDLEYFPSNSVLILRGEIVIPKPKKIAVELDF